MATRYLTALDFSDWNTQNVLRKHAKNRPLGQLEWRYRYTQEQPLLSCRTVELDAAGGGAGCGDGGRNGGGSLRTTSGVVKSAGVKRSASPSSSDIWQEQQKVLRHLLHNGGRAVKSAPSRRIQDTKGTEQKSNSSARRGRPSTSLSTSSNTSRPKSTASSSRFKSAGRPKSSPSSSNNDDTSGSFMVVTVDKDMLRTRRTYHDLTNRIHAHWRPGSSDLNQGHFRRGQKRPDDVPTASDAWLTFGGVTEEGAEGVIDAFANFQTPELYYNIVGSVGSRVAQQLRKGDRIRIGINGEVVSHDLRVKRWVKDKQDSGEDVEEKKEEEAPTEGGQKEERVEMEAEEEKEEEDDDEEEDNFDGVPGSEQKNPPSPASYTEQEEEFGELIVDSFDILTESPTEEDEEEEEEKEKLKEVEEKKEKDLSTVTAKVRDRSGPERGSSRPVPGKKPPILNFPLNWDDQVTRPEVKVISAHRGTRDANTENLCETHPVVYRTLSRRPHTTSRTRLSSSSSTSTSSSGYRTKQRPLSTSNSRGSSITVTSSAAVRNRLDSASGNKVRTITIDQNSEEQERRLQDMSVEDVIQTRLEVAAATAASSPIPGPMRGHLRSPHRPFSSSSSFPITSPGSQTGREESGGGGGEFRKCRSTGTLYGRQSNSARGDGGSSARSPRQKGSARSPAGWSPPPPTQCPPSPYSAYERRTLGMPRPSSGSVPCYHHYYYGQQGAGDGGGARDVRDLGTVSMRPLVMSAGRGGTDGGASGSARSSRTTDRQGSGKGSRPMTGQPQYRGPGNNGSPSVGSSSIMAGPLPGDPHFIQISQPIRNPNASRVALVSGVRSSFFYSPFPVNSMAASPVPPHSGGHSPLRSNTPENMLQEGADMRTSESDVFAALSRPLTPSVQGDLPPEEPSSSPQAGVTTSSTALNEGNGKESSREAAVSPVSGAALSFASSSGPPVHVMQAINIPTGNDEDDDDDDEETTEVQKGARTVVGEQQVDQITHLLGGATLGEEKN